MRPTLLIVLAIAATAFATAGKFVMTKKLPMLEIRVSCDENGDAVWPETLPYFSQSQYQSTMIRLSGICGPSVLLPAFDWSIKTYYVGPAKIVGNYAPRDKGAALDHAVVFSHITFDGRGSLYPLMARDTLYIDDALGFVNCQFENWAGDRVVAIRPTYAYDSGCLDSNTHVYMENVTIVDAVGVGVYIDMAHNVELVNLNVSGTYGPLVVVHQDPNAIDVSFVLRNSSIIVKEEVPCNAALGIHFASDVNADATSLAGTTIEAGRCLAAIAVASYDDE